MRYIADLHLHSYFSRATSKKSDLAGLFSWSQVKGIQVVGTGDFTHPGWFASLKEHLVPAEPGFFRLKEEGGPPALPDVTPEPVPVRFVLTAEVSSIYKKHHKVRKVHNILFAPDFESVERINAKLAAIGNIESDGRPILGLDCRDLLEILLEQAPQGFLVPAHIWTPWFSVFGSKSGFDALEECFEDLTPHIFALETGLSSDPDMNRLVSTLDRFTLISNSDCHSPAKLGREANLFETDFDFFAMYEALKNPAKGFLGTVEFFPEEGKYHLDGHRKCQVCLEPDQTRQLNALCPVCQRPLTIGVMHRVRELADRTTPYYPEGAPMFRSLIPLPEVLSEIMKAGPETKGVLTEYARVISLFGSEFTILLHTPIEEISRHYSPILGEAIQRIRKGQVIRQAGYDGAFGVIKVFAQEDLESLLGQTSLFVQNPPPNETIRESARVKYQPLTKQPESETTSCTPQSTLNPEQRRVIQSTAQRLLVIAGPGTGKTFTLVTRLAHLLSTSQISPRLFTVITFTNRAAEEVRERLTRALGSLAQEVFVGTFHAFCLHWLRKEAPDLVVVGEEARTVLVKNLFPQMDQGAIGSLQEEISIYFQHLTTATHPLPPVSPSVQQYLDALARQQGIDLEAVIPCCVQRLIQDSHFRTRISQEVRYLFIDEFQDLNAAQYALVKLLAEQAQVFAIGDPNQAIYGFRGGNLRYFSQFAEEYEVQTLPLTRNYRSAPSILEAATAVISHNTYKGMVTLIPQRTRSGSLEQYLAPTPQAEAEFVVHRIEELMGGISYFSIDSGRSGAGEGTTERSFGDVAVLYRLSQQVEVLREALERSGIPLQVVGVRPFFMEADLRVVYYWIRAATDPGAVEHLMLVEALPGIGPSTIHRLERELPLRYTDFFAQAEALHLSPRARTKLQEIQRMLQSFQREVTHKGLAVALLQTMTYFGIDPEAAHSKRLLQMAGAFGKDLVTFAYHLAQQSTSTIYDDRAEAVALMTLHAAKGLEFPVVFITGVEEGLIPCQLPGLASEVEEERRLFYVGLTRAQEQVILTAAATRTLFGQTRQQTVSRFLTEIPSHLLKKVEEGKRRRARKTPPTQLELF